MRIAWFTICGVLTIAGPWPAPAAEPGREGDLRDEFIYETAPFPQCHASTIVQSRDGTLVAAWFGGTREKHADVGIWVSRFVDLALDRARRSRQRRRIGRTTVSVLEPGFVSASSGAAAAVLQGRAEPQHVVGRSEDQRGSRADVVAACRLPDGILGPIRTSRSNCPAAGSCADPAPNMTAGGRTSNGPRTGARLGRRPSPPTTRPGSARSNRPCCCTPRAPCRPSAAANKARSGRAGRATKERRGAR